MKEAANCGLSGPSVVRCWQLLARGIARQANSALVRLCERGGGR